MTELRPYQQKLLEEVLSSLESTDKPVMMQLPTGGGKTVIAAALLSKYLLGRRKAVWLTHRRELASQTELMLSEADISATCNIDWTPHRKAPSILRCAVILMAQTVGRRTRIADDVWGDYDANDLMIIDEAHHAVAKSWERAIRQWPGKVLGMTATPWRLSKKEGFSHLFDELVLGPQVSELQDKGFLCKANVLVPDSEGRIFGGNVPSHLDYNPKSIEAANANRDVMTARALKFWQEHAENRQTIVYAVSIGHAENLAALFQEAGVSAEVIHSKIDQDRRFNAIDNFGNGNLNVLINVAIATEGFDLPDASCIVIARPTKSLSLYLQMVGRGLRRKDDGGNCLILDLAHNAGKHGLPEDYREWSLVARGEAESDGDAPVVTCNKCRTVSPAASHDCKSCGAPFGKVCPRCVKWRAFRSGWMLEELCNLPHDPVCDYCHADAHERQNLPTIPIENLLEWSARANPDYIANGELHKNPRIVSQALLATLGDMGGEGETGSVIRRIAELLYVTEGKRLGISLNPEDVRRHTWNKYTNLVIKGTLSLNDAQKHILIPIPDAEEIMKLTPSEQSKLLLIITYQDTSTHTNLRKSITSAYNQLKKSGHCDSNSPWGIWRLSISGRELAKNIHLQSPTGNE